jgi:hypothetical protein
VAFAGERPDLDALRELEDVLRHLTEELAGWRRRALTAEAKASDAARFAEDGDAGVGRLKALEDANRNLEQRLVTARAQVHEILGRLAFLGQQQGNGEGDHG